MKAMVHEKYGPPEVLQLKEVEKPVPKDNEVLVRIHAAAVNAIDPLIVRGKPFYLRITSGGFLKPKRKHQILGDDIAGQVEAVGKNVKKFQPGDEVFGISNWGGFAEYRCVPEDSLVLKPSIISFEEAAAVPIAAIAALQGLRNKRLIQPGQKVLIVGASGGVGTFAVQIAKYYGAEVTGVCSTNKIDMVRSIGADHVIDYKKEDFTKNGQLYDLILGVSAHRSIFDFKRALNPKGIYVCIGGSGGRFFQAMLLGPLISLFGNKKLGSMLPIPNQDDLIFLKELLETRKVVPVIDKRYPLSKAAEAIRYLGEGRAQGKIVISIQQNNKP
ncbi:MAG: NAD(P)-dependent alcohol dehydrogenase [Candidatus Hodarchaeales archaeon]|jgi:NADPH:quinone reductase-like Zn-dependent oxidoreductase